MSFASLWSDLESIGRCGSTGGYRRFAWTSTDAALREWFAAECTARGLDLTVDRAGNQWAWWGDPDARPGVVTGSHLDSVPDGGAFDGPLGVVGALLAVDALREQGFEPSRPIGVAAFADEEGARFGVACAGSRVLTGALAAERAVALRDDEGVTLGEAAAAHGVTGLGPDDGALRRVRAFVELHVEQGRGLADLGLPVAIGGSIWPHGRWRFELDGEANHAGTTRLCDRVDPMLALATLVTSARAEAERRGCLATVGKVLVEPNGVNAIPARVTAWLDARGESAHAVRKMVSALDADRVAEESWTAPTMFDPALVGRLSALLGGAPVLGTGAGHDAGILATAGIPAAMLFVRNPTGISHSPREYATEADCLAGVQALTAVLAELASERAVPPGGGASASGR